MSDLLPAGTQLGPYEIDSLIGAGGMGQVYRAHDPRLGRHVAVKTVAGGAADSDLVRRFETEARAAGALDHPNLLVVYDVGRKGNVSYIVSELLDGETLRGRLRHGALPTRQAIEYTREIARGLAAAHARGIIHRDLKPENLFLTRDGRVKILDFGVAKLVQAAENDAATVAASLTGAGVVVGTVGYMAPEQVRGEAVDHRADIFALGVVMHELLSGARPFQRDTHPETLTAILKNDPADLPPGVPPAVARVVSRCLEKRPEDRFHSAHDLGLALEVVSTTNQTGVSSAVVRAPGVSRRKALLYGASAAGLVAAGAAGGMWLGGRGGPAVPSFRRLTFRRGLIRSARVAPGGKNILYSALWEGGACRVYNGGLDNPDSHPVDLPEANILAISRTGELALALGPHVGAVITYGTLARVPMTGGTPRALVENVKFADWSPDGADLAIVRRVDDNDRLEFPVGKTLVQAASGEFAGFGFPRVSADGRRVAFVQYRSPGSLVGHVAITDQTGSVKRLSDEYLNVHGLAWRGDEILYTAADKEPLYRPLRAVTPGGAHRTITRMPGNATLWDVMPDGRLLLAHTDDRAALIARRPDDVSDRDLSWHDASWPAGISRDGRWVLFSEYGLAGGQANSVYLRGMDGSPAVRLSDGYGLALSPDARWALCLSGNGSQLDLVPTGAGDRRRLADNGLRYTGASWLPGGDRVVVSALEPGHRVRLYVLDLEQGRPTAISPEGISPWVVSPDGATIAASGDDRLVRLYPVDGSGPQDLRGMTGRETPIGWITDGLLVTRPSDPEAPLGEIYLVDSQTGTQTSWRNILPRDAAGVMGYATFHVTPDGRSQAYSWHRALSSLYIADGLI